jgi:hypothetical protein
MAHPSSDAQVILLSPIQTLDALKHLEPEGKAELWRVILRTYQRDAMLRAHLDCAFKRYVEEERAFATWVEQQCARRDAEAEYLAGPHFVKY